MNYDTLAGEPHQLHTAHSYFFNSQKKNNYGDMLLTRIVDGTQDKTNIVQLELYDK